MMDEKILQELEYGADAFRDPWDVVMGDLRRSLGAGPARGGKPPDDVIDAYDEVIPGARRMLEQGVEDERRHQASQRDLLARLVRSRRRARVMVGALAAAYLLLLVLVLIR